MPLSRRDLLAKVFPSLFAAPVIAALPETTAPAPRTEWEILPDHPLQWWSLPEGARFVAASSDPYDYKRYFFLTDNAHIWEAPDITADRLVFIPHS